MYFKRRIKDSWEITKDMVNQINYKNAIIVIIGMFIMIPLVWFIMLFEDYDEIDRFNNYGE